MYYFITQLLVRTNKEQRLTLFVKMVRFIIVWRERMPSVGGLAFEHRRISGFISRRRKIKEKPEIRLCSQAMGG